MFCLRYQYQKPLLVQIKFNLQNTQIAFIFCMMKNHTVIYTKAIKVSSVLPFCRKQRRVHRYGGIHLNRFVSMFKAPIIKGSCSIQLSYRTDFLRTGRKYTDSQCTRKKQCRLLITHKLLFFLACSQTISKQWM